MSEAIAREVAIKKSGQAPPHIERNQAISFLVQFDEVKHLLGQYPAPRRPNRNQPVGVDDPELHNELIAWEAASDEAFEAMEDDLPE